MHRGRYLLNLIILLVSLEALAQQEDSSHPPSNLDLIRKLSLQVCDTISTFVSSGDSARVFLRPETAWYVEGTILKGLSAGGRIIMQSLLCPIDIELGILNVQVVYSNPRRRGLFGARLLDRDVRIEFSAKVVDMRSGIIRLNEQIGRSVRDTIEAGDIETIETPGISATHGIVPGEGFFSSLVEPFVAIGAIAVAVYLLFHVRS